MTREVLYKDMIISPAGKGLAFYSEGAAGYIPVGEDFLHKEYQEPEQIAAHIKRGDIVAVSAECDADIFDLRFRSGYPDDDIMERYPAHIQLGIEAVGNRLNVVDLYWLADWKNSCPPEQQVEIVPGTYQMILCGEPPMQSAKEPPADENGDEYRKKSKIIYIYMNPVETMPEHDCKGMPCIYWAYGHDKFSANVEDAC